MLGPEIMARSISALQTKDKYGNVWQYNSRSDRHSRITCWAIMFDFFRTSALLRAHVAAGKVGFGINHELRDFQTGRKKNLDLVVCTPNSSAPYKPKKGKKSDAVIATFVDLAAASGVILTPREQVLLNALPHLPIVSVGGVNVALEAKATMTEHVKAAPRLHDELDSSHLTVHGHADHAIAAALVTINVSDSFISSDRHKRFIGDSVREVTKHTQPNATLRTIDKVLEIRRRSAPGQAGFDAIGIVLVSIANDGTPCTVVATPPAPQPTDSYHYDQMINRLVSLYSYKFSSL